MTKYIHEDTPYREIIGREHKRLKELQLEFQIQGKKTWLNLNDLNSWALTVQDKHYQGRP